jgi:hypothetical protein
VVEKREIFAFFFEQNNNGFTVISGLVKSDYNQAALVGADVAVTSDPHKNTKITGNSITVTLSDGMYTVIALTTDDNFRPDLPIEITVAAKDHLDVVIQIPLPPDEGGTIRITEPELVMRADDGDGDGIPDVVENASPCPDPRTTPRANDADTDDDGIADGEEDTNKNGVKNFGETDPCRLDTDNDSIQDGTELGLTLNDIGSDTDTAIFQPDLEPSTKTNPLDKDSDNDGLLDGEEDKNHNGRVDAGESDPNFSNLSTLRALPHIPLLLLSD